jgi:DNA-binding LytR/AlgR family response regulator
MLNCVIVDDEQFSVDGILKYINLNPKLTVSGVFMDPIEAAERIMVLDNIDILFMDINMPNLSGIDLARSLRSKAKKLIFTTSHSIYAYDAFEVEADAYLLKPYTFAKFVAVVNRLFPIDKQEETADYKNGREDLKKTDEHLSIEQGFFLVKNTNENLRIENIYYADVIAFESLNNYVKIHLTDHRSIIAYLTVHDVIALLGSRAGFKQFHRSYIIATKYISFIEANTIKMTNNLVVPVGDRFKNEFQHYLLEKLAMTSRNKSTS